MSAVASRLRGAGLAQVGLALGLGLLAGLAVAGAPRELTLSIVAVGCFAALIAAIVVRVVPEGEATFLLWTFVLAVVLRLGMAIFLHYTVSDRKFLAGDDAVYEKTGLLLARAWEEGRSLRSHLYGLKPYHYWNAFLFYFLGPVKLLPKALNALIGACVVFPAYRLTKNVFQDQWTARLATVLVATLPSLVLWCSLNLRDATAILAIALLVDAAVTVRMRPTVWRVAVMVPLFVLLGLIRSYMVLVVGLGLGLSLLAVRSRHLARDFFFGTLAVLGILFVVRYIGFGADFATDVSLERMNTVREGLTRGGSAFGEGADISTPGGAITHLPLGLAYLLFAPFPWQIQSLRQVLSVPEVLIFYAGFPFIVIGLREVLRVRPGAALPALGTLTTVLVSYALVEANVGTAYRHKAQVLTLMVVFGAGGFALWRKRRLARRQAVVTAMPARTLPQRM